MLERTFVNVTLVLLLKVNGVLVHELVEDEVHVNASIKLQCFSANCKTSAILICDNCLKIGWFSESAISG